MSQILSCSEQGHEGQEITTLCLKKGCQHKSVLLCSLCKTGGHKEHQQYQIPLKQLSNPDSFPYWPREEEEVCNQAKDLVFEKYQANQDAKIDALFDTFQERLISELKATKEKVKSQIGSKGDFWTNLEQLFNSVFVIKQIRDKVELLKSGQLKTDAFAQQLSGLLDNQERSEKLDELRQECTHLTELSSLLTLPKLAELMASNMQSIFSAEGDTQPIIQSEEADSEKQEQPKAKPDEGTSIQDVADLILQQKPEEAKLELDAESPDNIGNARRPSRSLRASPFALLPCEFSLSLFQYVCLFLVIRGGEGGRFLPRPALQILSGGRIIRPAENAILCTAAVAPVGLIKRLSRKSPSLRYDEIKVVFLGGKGVGKTSIIN